MSPDGKVSAISTDYQLGQDNIALKVGPFGLDIHNRVFLISALSIVLFVLFTLILGEGAGVLFTDLRSWVISQFDSFFLVAGNIFILVCFGLLLSPLGKVRIGGTEATPDYSYSAWISMLFAAGMGIALMFYGVAEPLGHYNAALGGIVIEDGVRTDWAPIGAAGGDMAAAQALGMSATIFHWGLNAWAIYAVLALSLAIFAFNKGLPLTMRSVFYPIFGERVWGWTGHVIDILAVITTLFGLATSLGFGAAQAAAGLNFLFGIENSTTTQVILIIAIISVAILSCCAGLDAGVKRLSQLNMGLAAILLLFVVVVGPTLAIATGFFSSMANYVKDLPALSMPFGREDENFSQGWTVFYWAWWVSWSPFVGMFIARISRGRTVREFMTCVLVVPTLACALWFSSFGTTAIMKVQQGFDSISEAELPLQLFAMLDTLPLSEITSFIAIILVIVFFITSSDSGSLVIDTISAGGKVDAPTPQRIFWCSLQGLVAIALLIGGGLGALQAMAISTGLPFTVILLLGCFCLVKGLMSEHKVS
ncbi:BCCT family transporter [Vibrio sp. ZSDE26]|uniref:BCCT family transporter n=1 Tax=Vibrio amylolyticus TaxID=2847292 RepID=A0A9X1XS74_9VIBR|nr:BCCT family transporter [Vibrio amylolyticus]MCK6264609.1 BCCT family transporter [Vibrio amylolyticus]